MVVDEVEDLDVGAVEQRPVRHIALPAFVGLVRFEPNEGALRTLPGFRGDEPPTGQDPIDGGRRGCRSVEPVEVPGDGLWTCVGTEVAQFLAEPHDRLLDGFARPSRGTRRTPGPLLESGLTLQAIAGHEVMDPALGASEGGCDLSHRPSFDQYGIDDHPTEHHGQISQKECPLCLATCCPGCPELTHPSLRWPDLHRAGRAGSECLSRAVFPPFEGPVAGTSTCSADANEAAHGRSRQPQAPDGTPPSRPLPVTTR